MDNTDEQRQRMTEIIQEAVAVHIIWGTDKYLNVMVEDARNVINEKTSRILEIIGTSGSEKLIMDAIHQVLDSD